MSVRSLILEAYRFNNDIVNDDDALTEYIWRRQGWRSDRPLIENIRLVTDQQTIKRERRTLHNERLIDYSEETETKRFKLFKQNRDNYSRAVRAPESFLRQYGERYE